MVPGDRLLLGIGHKYNPTEVIYFIAIEGEGITKPGIKYSSNYPDKFENVAI